MTPVGASKNLKSGTCCRKIGKAGPNLILENLFNFKSTFICDLAKKPTIFREQNFKHFNLISFYLITTFSIVKGHL